MDKTLSKSQRLIAKKEALKITAKIIPLTEKIDSLSDKLTTKVEEISEPTPTEDGNDIGMFNKDIEKKSVSFVSQHLKELWDIPGYSASMKNAEKATLSILLQDVISKSKYTGKNQPVNEEGIAKEFQDYLYNNMNKKVSISSEGKKKLRQWLTSRNFSKQVRYIRVDDNGINIQKDGEFYTRAGNKELVIEPKKAIEEAHEAYDAILGKKPSKDPIYTVLKTITENVDGVYTDKPLSRFRADIKRVDEGNLGRYYAKIKEIFTEMDKKGYYPFGGKSDADAIYFVKKHPLEANRTVQKKLTNAIIKSIGKVGTKQLLSADKTFKELYGIDSKKAVNMAFSNMLYDMDINGINPALNGKAKNQIEWNKSIKRLLNEDKDFHTIKNGTAWNKRQQIWFTPGFKADPTYIENYFKSLKLPIDLIKEDGQLKYKYILSKDVKKEGLITTKSKNSEDETSVDGMTTVRDDVLDAINADAGMEANLGQNKNFIVSPDAEHGALLGKHMMHSAGPEMSAAMKKRGIHMIMQESAVKQRGSRKLNSYGQNTDGTMFFKNNNDTYTLPVQDVKYNYSVVQGYEMLNPKRIPKQVLTHITQNTFAPFSKELMQDFFNDTVIRRYEGDVKANKRLDDYIRVPNEADAEYVLKNLDNVGISRLLQAIKHGSPEFSDAAYAQIMKFNKEMIRDLVSSGEVTEADVKEMESSIVDFDTPAQRMIKEGSMWSKSERHQGRDGAINPIFLHKNVRNFRLL